MSILLKHIYNDIEVYTFFYNHVMHMLQGERYYIVKEYVLYFIHTVYKVSTEGPYVASCIVRQVRCAVVCMDKEPQITFRFCFSSSSVMSLLTNNSWTSMLRYM